MEKEEEEVRGGGHLHGAVRPLLMADKVVGGQHHLADVAVKARLVPVLKRERKAG